MKKICTCFVLLLMSIFLNEDADAKNETANANFIDHAGYSNCIKLENQNTRVVLGAHCGGRVLEYSWKGQNAIYLDSAHDGWVYHADKPTIDPSGGRFDIGPESIIPKHPELWLGKWTAEIVDSNRARLISAEDDATGTQLIREFRLDKLSSHLVCKQIIKNVSKETKTFCHWGRTFALGEGICLIPLSPNSRFPKKYIMYGPGPVMNYRPEDPNIRVRDGMLEILGTPKRPKLGMDSYAGWFCYLMKNNLMFIKRYPTYPNRVYNEMAALTISIWYYKDRVCELEPIGPMETILPGQSTSFSEEWWIVPYDFPDKRMEVNLEEVKQVVDLVMKPRQ
ncbi:MAG: hypothetical protein QGI86_17420 [Candidatus Poribacteria bacterium]|nr:hypothetical protein [Candidatus Poribacteria bacterium]MDP6961190.1 hypothetical protein [Dehalococcoidia bacterium]